MENPDPSQLPEKKDIPQCDCLSVLIFVLLSIWIAFVSYIRYLVILTTTINPTSKANLYSGLSALGYFILLALPLIPLAFLWRNALFRKIFQTWLLASLLIVFILPVHITNSTAAQTHSLLQIFILVVFIFLLILFKKKRIHKLDGNYIQSATQDKTEKPNFRVWRTNAWLLIILISSISAYPWLAWGALGSILDSLLLSLFAFFFALSAILLVNVYLFQSFGRLKFSFWGYYFIGGVASGVVLLILASATAFGYGTMQLLLLLVLPGAGWILVGLFLSHPIHAVSSFDNYFEHKWFRFQLPFTALIGFLAAAPLLLFDSDELILVIGASLGENISFAFRAAFISMFVILFFGFLILLYLLSRKTKPGISAPTIPNRYSWISLSLGLLTLTAIGIALLIYSIIGQTGFYGERIFVILKNQANLSEAKQIDDYEARKEYVYHQLVEHAVKDQLEIRMSLDRLGIEYTPYYLVNAIELNGNPLIRLWLLTRPEIDRILDSPRLRPLPNLPPSNEQGASKPLSPQWNLIMIGADQVWELGYTGQGIIIGQSDSGVQSDHPELESSYRGANGDHNYNWFDPWEGTLSPIDLGGHGTHTLGSITGKNTGVAPGATWYACRNLARNLGNPALYFDCLQFMLAPFPLDGDPFIDGSPSLGAHVLNNSWGCPDVEGCDIDTFSAAMNALQEAGVFVVASAGNDGPACETLNTPPPIYANVFAVGAIDRTGNLASFSSVGPVTKDDSGRIKPDIVAPGVNVLSAMPGGTYGFSSGTSMAGPHVVGVVALMWSANPNLIGDIDTTREILVQSAQPYNGALPICPGAKDVPSTAVGYGVVDAVHAVQLALEAK